jgi:hypothetical protein
MHAGWQDQPTHAAVKCGQRARRGETDLDGTHVRPRRPSFGPSDRERASVTGAHRTSLRGTVMTTFLVPVAREGSGSSASPSGFFSGIRVDDARSAF